jgi:N-acetylglucosaminyl-diphospho-decaprenol L-rhamnosyltransferase
LKTNKQIFAVIPTFNRKDMLKECIISLLNQSYSCDQIVIVNSGSTDGTTNMLQKYNKNVVVIDGNDDWWWAKCMNEGITYAQKNGADYIFALNDDIYLDHNALKFLLETSSFFPNCIIGCIVKDRNNSIRAVSRGVGVKYSKYRWIPFKKIIDNISGRDIYYTEGQSGRGVLFPISVYKKIGIYDTKNFPHRGDRDFSFRCVKAGIGQYLDTGALAFLNFDTSYLNIESIRLKFPDIKNALFHKNGLYNIEHQLNFLKKHYYFTWVFWFILWITYVFLICFIRILPGGTKVIRTLKPLLKSF